MKINETLAQLPDAVQAFYALRNKRTRLGVLLFLLAGVGAAGFLFLYKTHMGAGFGVFSGCLLAFWLVWLRLSKANVKAPDVFVVTQAQKEVLHGLFEDVSAKTQKHLRLLYLPAGFCVIILPILAGYFYVFTEDYTTGGLILGVGALCAGAIGAAMYAMIRSKDVLREIVSRVMVQG